jgi:NAD+ diphosphatase
MRYSYCPYCGEKTIEKEIGDEGLIPFCEKCSIPLWDSFRTCIITAVVNECNEVALLKQNYVSTWHVCVAGVMKLGESAEETVVREVKEELGLDVEELTYIQSYPYEAKELLMLGFKAKVKKADFVLSGEVDSAHWFQFDEALGQMREGSIAWQLVKRVIEE